MKRSTLFALVAAAVIAGAVIVLVAFQNGGGSSSAGAESAAEASVQGGDLLAPGPIEEKVLGNPDAPITVVEYASLSCSHCAEFHMTTFPQIRERFIDTGKVRFIFRDFPLDNFAMAGSMLARCGGEGKYFPIVDAFFEQQKSLAPGSDAFEWLQSFAKQVGFTEESFEACLSNRELQDNLTAVRQRASEKFGVNSTPTFFINGKIRRGALTIEEFEKEIEPLLKG